MHNPMSVGTCSAMRTALLWAVFVLLVFCCSPYISALWNASLLFRCLFFFSFLLLHFNSKPRFIQIFYIFSLWFWKCSTEKNNISSRSVDPTRSKKLFVVSFLINFHNKYEHCGWICSYLYRCSFALICFVSSSFVIIRSTRKCTAFEPLKNDCTAFLLDTRAFRENIYYYIAPLTNDELNERMDSMSKKRLKLNFYCDNNSSEVLLLSFSELFQSWRSTMD